MSPTAFPAETERTPHSVRRRSRLARAQRGWFQEREAHAGAPQPRASIPCFRAAATGPGGDMVTLSAPVIQGGAGTDKALAISKALSETRAVRFGGAGGGAAVAVERLSDTVLAVRCPASSDGSMDVSAELLDAAGELVGDFAFVYEAPPPSVAPEQLLSGGGAVSLTLYEPDPVPQRACTITFGGAPGSISAVDLPGTNVYTVRATAPPGAGVVAIALACPVGGVLGAAQQTGAFLRYLRGPVVESAQPMACTLGQACDTFITISSPASTMLSAAAVVADISGVEIGPHRGGSSTAPKVQISSQTTELLSLRVVLPPPRSAGTLALRIQPATAPPGLTPAAFAVLVSFAVPQPPAKIVSLRPSVAASAGGVVLALSIAAFPNVAVSAPPSVSFGGVPSPAVTVLVVDAEGAQISAEVPFRSPAALAPAVSDSIPAVSDPFPAVSDCCHRTHLPPSQVPERAPGVLQLTVSDPTDASVNASASVLLTAPGLEAACTQGCDLPEDGGPAGGTTLAVKGFAGAAAPSDLGISVEGAAGAVASLQVVGNGHTLRVTPPAAPGGLAATSRVTLLRVAAAWDGTVFAYARVTYWRAPRILSAKFDALGAAVVLVTDQDTDGQGSVTCASALVSLGGSLGTGAECVWRAPARLAVVLGRGATILPGERVRLLAGAGADVRSANGVSDAMAQQEVVVQVPAQPAAPTLLLTGPSEIGACDTAHFHASGNSPRPLTFAWSSRTHPALAANLSAVTGPEVATPPSPPSPPGTNRTHISPPPRTNRTHISPPPRTNRTHISPPPRTTRTHISPPPRTNRTHISPPPRTNRTHISPPPRTNRTHISPRRRSRSPGCALRSASRTWSPPRRGTSSARRPRPSR